MDIGRSCLVPIIGVIVVIAANLYLEETAALLVTGVVILLYLFTRRK